jgi:hypothetical protein
MVAKRYPADANTIASDERDESVLPAKAASQLRTTAAVRERANDQLFLENQLMRERYLLERPQGSTTRC